MKRFAAHDSVASALQKQEELIRTEIDKDAYNAKKRQ